MKQDSEWEKAIEKLTKWLGQLLQQIHKETLQSEMKKGPCLAFCLLIACICC